MALSRKRQKELNRLKGQAQDLWDDQKQVLENASRVVREASRQAGKYARNDLPPRVREAYDERVRPAVDAGIASARSTANSTRDRLVDDVLPAVSSALSSAMAVLEVAKNPRVRQALARVTSASADAASGLGASTARKPGPGRYILIGIGLIAAVGVAYAAWQTVRADDDLWVEDEDSEG